MKGQFHLIHLPVTVVDIVIHSLSYVWLFAPPGTIALLSYTISCSLPKFMSIELVMLSNHLILCHPFLLLPLIFLDIRIFFKESALHITWPKYWSFSFSSRTSNEDPGLISYDKPRQHFKSRDITLLKKGSHSQT